MTRKQKIDIHQAVTDSIIAKLEAGPDVWKKTWSTMASGGLPTRFTGQHYQGINLLVLAMQGRPNPNWMTYKQAKEVGGQVRGGEKGTMVVFFKPLKVEKDGKEETIPLLRQFTVFNADQIDGLPAKFYPAPQDAVHAEPRIEDAEAYLSATKANIRHGGDRAFFSPQQDFIQLPEFDQFDDAVAYYGAAMHELVHWSGGEKRLDRDLKNQNGTKDYAKEELVAEIGAAFLTATLGIETEVRDDHAQYLAHWLTILRDDKKAIFKAAAMAQKAADHLDGYQPTEQEQAA
jgi:antirestriction protein ArdC